MTETARKADIVLPGASFAEKEGTFTNTDRHVLRVRKAVEPPGIAKEDAWYIKEISKKLGYEMSYNSASDIMNEIAGLTPSYGGINYQRLENEALQWPCLNTEHKGTGFMHADSFPRGLGKLHPVQHQDLSENKSLTYPFVLNTGRNLYHYHTATMSRRSLPLKSYSSHPYLEIHPLDMEQYQLKENEPIWLESSRGKIRAWIRSSKLVSRGELFLPFHFHESAPNFLTSGKLDPYSKIPRYKQTPCRIIKV